MTNPKKIISVALYFNGRQFDSIPLDWFVRACDWLDEHNMSPVLFTAAGGDFTFDDCYFLADADKALFSFQAVIKGRRGHLVDALRKGLIYGLGMDSPRADAEDRSQWRANISVDSSYIYLGLDEDIAQDASALLRRAHALSKGLFDVRYGIAYKMLQTEEPASYAIGCGPFSFADFREMMRSRSEGIRQPPTPNDLWRDELRSKKRHLTGLFRGAYPASVLSQAHVKAADLLEQPVGKLTAFDDSLWLWELSESEIPRAEAMLVKRRLLVSQAS